MTTIAAFMETLCRTDKSVYRERVLRFVGEFGFAKPCNRFPGGNLNEYLVRDVIRKAGYSVEVLTNAVRVDIQVADFRKFSIKYSSRSDIKLHNSNNMVNRDMKMVDTLLVTPTEWWFLDMESAKEVGVCLEDYLKNKGDGLSLKRSALRALKKANYPHIFAFDIRPPKHMKREERDCAEIMYEYIKALVPDSEEDAAPPRE